MSNKGGIYLKVEDKPLPLLVALLQLGYCENATQGHFGVPWDHLNDLELQQVLDRLVQDRVHPPPIQLSLSGVPEGASVGSRSL